MTFTQKAGRLWISKLHYSKKANKIKRRWSPRADIGTPTTTESSSLCLTEQLQLGLAMQPQGGTLVTKTFPPSDIFELSYVRFFVHLF